MRSTVLSRWIFLQALMSFFLAGCTGSPESLSQQLNTLLALFPNDVSVVEEVILLRPDDDRDLALRIAFPSSGGSFPLVIFSHGAFCFPESYAGITDHWVSHGYVVILLNHWDSPNSQLRLPANAQTTLVASRARDMSFVLDSLDQIEQVVPALSGKIDRTRLGVAGHSFGGMIALIKAGLSLKDPESPGVSVSYADNRFSAAVVMSGVGVMPLQMNDDAFDSVQFPLIATGGTLDIGNVGDGNEYPWEWRMGAFTLTPPGDKYSVVLDEGDHYLGGLICRPDRGGEADPEGLAIDAATTTAFLDGYLKQDQRAKRFLSSFDLGAATNGRAELKSR